MPNAGRTTTSGNTTVVQNSGSNNQYGFAITMPATGLVQWLDVYMAGSGGTCRTILCLWNSSGVLLAQTAQFTASAGSGGVNGQAFQRAALTSPLVINAGTYYVGFWRNSADSAEWSYLSGGGTIHPQAPLGGVANVGSPGSLSFANSTSGQMSAYLEYVQGGLGLAGGGVYHKYALKRWNNGASAWQRHPLKRWNATSGQWEWLA